MVTHVDEISTPPTPADAPEVFEQRASQVWSDLARAVPQFNQAASEIEQIGQDAGAAKVRAIAEADAAMGYRNEAVAARDSAQADAVSAAQADASAVLAAARAETAAESAETAAASAENRVPMTGPAGAAILPEGTDAERPVPGETGFYVRLNKTSGRPEWFNRTTAAWEPVGDTSQLATQLGVVDAKVQTLDANTGFTIIYPNGGTAAAPANVAINSRYVLSNPFPGHHVMCIAEVLYNGSWGETGWAFAESVPAGYGVKASMLDSSIVVQTGGGGFLSASSRAGGSFGNTGAAVTTPLPCRVKVWKLKGGA